MIYNSSNSIQTKYDPIQYDNGTKENIIQLKKLNSEEIFISNCVVSVVKEVCVF